VDRGGPSRGEDADFHAIVRQLAELSPESGNPETIAAVRDWVGPALSGETLQGFALRTPHGYAGDFEMIDRIYRYHISADPALANWDLFFHRQTAPRAVRNRKTYFHDLLDRHSARRSPLDVLKIASGPGRSMFEWLGKNPDAPVSIDCVDIDPVAIDFARNLNRAFLDRITFTRANVLRYRPGKPYDLIWIAGLFDYFDDALFVRLLARLAPFLSPGGELVIGNFSDRNPSRAYMELLGDWHLHHRNEDQLAALARRSGISEDRVHIGVEPEGLNLFLHIRHPQV
jgi:SAM-dependent methyltransferase